MQWEEAAFPQVKRGVYGTRVHGVTLAAANRRPAPHPAERGGRRPRNRT